MDESSAKSTTIVCLEAPYPSPTIKVSYHTKGRYSGEVKYMFIEPGLAPTESITGNCSAEAGYMHSTGLLEIVVGWLRSRYEDELQSPKLARWEAVDCMLLSSFVV